MKFYQSISSILVVLTLVQTAHAQVAHYNRGSIYDLDPPSQQSSGNPMLESIIISKRRNNLVPMIRFNPKSTLRGAGRPVGRLAMKLRHADPDKSKIEYCTASLISDDLILTNHHCIPGHGVVEDAMLQMGYLQAGSDRGVSRYGVELTPVEKDKNLDYAILKVRGKPGRKWGHITFLAKDVYDSQALFIIHHPGGSAQHISRGNCLAASPALSGKDLRHLCDTHGGSSGAPIFEDDTKKVVALHYRTIDFGHLNAGVRISRILQHSPLLRGLVKGQKELPAAQAAPKISLLTPDGLSARVIASDENTKTGQELYEEGKTEFTAKRYAKALQLFRKAEMQGNFEASNAIGLIYLNGLGVEKDYSRARNLFEEAAVAGSNQAMYNLGLMYGLGVGVVQNDSQAAKWYGKAVNRGHSGAMVDLGTLYLYGRGVKLSHSNALKLFKRADNLGVVHAKTKIAIMYINGTGVKQNIAKAMGLLRTAAARSDAKAMLLLGTFYDQGIGVKRNWRIALKWIVKALATGDKEVGQMFKSNTTSYSAKLRRGLKTALIRASKRRGQ